MQAMTSLLVVLNDESDFCSSDATPPAALSKAKRLIADKADTKLHLLCVAYNKYLDHDYLALEFNQREKRRQHCDELTSQLNAMVEELQSEGYRASGKVVWGHPRYEAVLAGVEETGADLVVQPARSYGAIELHHLSNDAWQLVRQSPVPLLLVKNSSWQDKPSLLAAIDPVHSHDKPQDLDKRILDTALAAQSQLGAELHVLHAYAELARPFAPAGVIEAEHRAALDALMANYSIPASHVHFVDKTPTIAIEQQLNSQHANIVVMGALARSRLYELLIGSTAEQVLDFLAVDILIVKPDLA